VLRRSAAAAWRRLRNVPHLLLRRRRHREALARLAAMRPPRSILVICHGNICRSPYLAAMLESQLPGVHVTSAGFVGAGRPVPANSLILLDRRGIDLSNFRSRPINVKTARECDMIIVMDADQRMRLIRLMHVPAERIFIAGDLDPVPMPTRAVLDPWTRPLEVFEAAFRRLDRCAATVVAMTRRADLSARSLPAGARDVVHH
jgi:protein-tyrosine phosphatase